ncbi:amino acid ABC transporter permease [Polycladomyces sp. WAk]|uniref:Amino acid ABC transporter permease n=1 Tax=Polycladomyces zharkentensis TaxID=2807616 RepID=A0ABS2WMA5_9BACL|nr:amino acid ABC transporter permease [Polycladomyces sp. WAk]MBN2910425.1 amino acid ABC transporter permease [Polycladomyces sp. WAk]
MPVDLQHTFAPATLRSLMEGLLVTLEVAASAIVLSFVFGIILGILRYTKLPVLSQLAVLYIEVMRNLPLLLIIFFGYFGLRDMGIELPVTMAAITGLTVFTSALIAEIVRSGLNSVEKGQIEAARAQGFTYSQTLWYIILPQGLKRMIPPLVSQFITLVKDTSLAVVISLEEIMHNAQIVYNKYVNATIPLLILVAFIYFTINYSLSRVSRYLEKRLAG